MSSKSFRGCPYYEASYFLRPESFVARRLGFWSDAHLDAYLGSGLSSPGGDGKGQSSRFVPGLPSRVRPVKKQTGYAFTTNEPPPILYRYLTLKHEWERGSRILGFRIVRRGLVR